MRQHYGIAQEEEEEEEEAPPNAAASRYTYDLLEDLEQVGVLEEVGISLQRWAQLRGVPMEYALPLPEYPDQEEQEANREGRRAVDR